MPAPDSFPPSSRDETVDPAARRQQLALLCALDRAHLRLLLLPAPSRPAADDGAFGDLLRTLLRLARFMPGRVGRWSRRAGRWSRRAGVLEALLRLFR